MASSPGTSVRHLLPLLDRYVLRQLLIALLALTGGAVALIWLTQSLHFVSMIVQHGLSLRVFLQLTSLMLPSFVAVILPITTFLVVLFTYQRMSGDRELTVMRAAGLSPLELARPGLICGVTSVALCYVLTLWLAPVSYHAFHRYEFQIRNQMAAFLLQEGVFTKVSGDMTVYVRSRDANGLLHGVLVEDDRDPDAHTTILAERGTIVTVNDKPRVVLYNGSREEIDHHTGRLNVLTFGRNTVDLTSSHQNNHEERDAAEMSLHELFHPNPAEVSERDRGKFAVEGWHRLTAPLTVLSFAMIGLVAVLRGAFSRHGNITRPLTAILTVVGLQALTLMLQNLAGRNLALVPLIWAAALLPSFICAALLFAEQWTGTSQQAKQSS
ncbi:transporter [Gluconobacter japonicus]|uniref:LPS export ABC transporter permease LptF n=1 Tax=Gluconobacter japonicus TaxID=376620 RepID=A0A9Q2FNV4_GLUJA|nr:LPS export ABC transporter permease LptF [Gluconobacter japonicus]GAP23482.1 transporter YjgP/YjgQ [Gluconobacter frateurii NBRC 101659]KXV25849.1 transporter [Gluconobacter japonicus]KXV39393.1 transporter [Gluconobacter japonicus]MBF0871252.1 LPS export ABC transporter permease LptF [Gluconobacter japonicus]GBR19657.1 transporter YjgP/YjgQ [Gluconobacter japonicus NBRC 3271]